MTISSWAHYTVAGERVYAIGDIHGQFPALENIYKRIHFDLNARPVQNYRIVVLGDIIDRGEFSRHVVDFLMARQRTEPITVLRGNHEDMLLRALASPEYLLEWRKYGGLETMLSFRVDMSGLMKGRDIESTHASFVEKFGQERVAYLRSLPYSMHSGDYFFCHAGIRPNRAIAEQDLNDLIWIRDEFLTSSQQHEKFIIHGHTPVERIDLRTNRLNLDTGAYLTGRLTCAVFEGNTASIFDTKGTEFTSIF